MEEELKKDPEVTPVRASMPFHQIISQNNLEIAEQDRTFYIHKDTKELYVPLCFAKDKDEILRMFKDGCNALWNSNTHYVSIEWFLANLSSDDHRLEKLKNFKANLLYTLEYEIEKKIQKEEDQKEE